MKLSHPLLMITSNILHITCVNTQERCKMFHKIYYVLDYLTYRNVSNFSKVLKWVWGKVDDREHSCNGTVIS